MEYIFNAEIRFVLAILFILVQAQGGWSAISLFFSVGLLLYHDKNTSSNPHFFIVGDTVKTPTELNWFDQDILNIQQK